jgi:hypothetical protein
VSTSVNVLNFGWSTANFIRIFEAKTRVRIESLYSLRGGKQTEVQSAALEWDDGITGEQAAKDWCWCACD